jgi:hypothetical protein
MALSFNQALAYRLGWSARHFDPRYTHAPIQFPDYSSDDLEALQVIIDKLVAIDEELETNRKDSMALDVGGVKVDFNRNIQITRQEGTRLLKELSQLSDIPIRYDKYLGRSPGENSVTPLVVRNYF